MMNRSVFLLLAALAGPASAQEAVSISGPGRVDEAFIRCVGSASPFKEAEAYAAVNPENPGNIVTAWQVNSKTGGAIQVSASFDCGRTWSVPHTLAINACAGGPFPRLLRASDSWITFGPGNHVYVTAIGFLPSEAGPDLASGILVFASIDGGRNWKQPGTAFSSDRPFRWHDNIAIAADPKHTDYVYAVTTRYEYPELEDTKPGDDVPEREPGAPELKSFGPAAFARSVDGGKTWSEPSVITPMVEGRRVSAPQLIVDPKRGRLYVIYYHEEKDRAALSLVMSEDQGKSWTKPAQINDFVTVPDHHRPGTGEFVQLAEDVVQVALDPMDGSLYLAFADGRFTGGKTLAVALTFSRDGATTWSPPIRVSAQDATTAWLPGVAVDAKGRVGVVYLKAGFDEGGPLLPVSVRLRTYSVLERRLVDEGERILDRFDFVWPGDYLALVATGQEFRVVYVGAGTGDSNPTEVFFR